MDDRKDRNRSKASRHVRSRGFDWPARSYIPGGHSMNNERLFHASEMLVISREISVFVYEEITRGGRGRGGSSS